MFFDALGVKYEYEPEGFVLSDGTYYLPDFYLPESKSWFEVKGEMDEASSHKIDQFIKEGNHMTIGYPGFEFNSMVRGAMEGESAYFAGSEASWLCECVKCGKKWFMGTDWYWGCPCCGAYDGDGHFIIIADGDPDGWNSSSEYERAVNAAKRARFEHGENVTTQKQFEKAFLTRW